MGHRQPGGTLLGWAWVAQDEGAWEVHEQWVDSCGWIAPHPVPQFPPLETSKCEKMQAGAVICLSWVWGH